MLKKVLKLNGVQELNNNEQKQTKGGHVGGIGNSNPNISWKCYRNNSGNRFFISPVDLNSPTTVCYPISNGDSAPSHPVGPTVSKPM